MLDSTLPSQTVKIFLAHPEIEQNWTVENFRNVITLLLLSLEWVSFEGFLFRIWKYERKAENKFESLKSVKHFGN